MTESTATLPPAPVRPQAEPVSETVSESGPERRWSPVAVAIWSLFAVGLVLFVAFARVPIEAGWRVGRSMRVRDIWSLFTLELAQVAGPLVTPALATGLAVVVLGGCLLGVSLAMSVTNNSVVELPD